MKYKRLTILRFAIELAFIVSAGGCIGVRVTSDDLVPASIAPVSANQRLEGSVNVQAKIPAVGGGYPFPRVIIVSNWVDSVKLRVALEKALTKNGLFSRIEQGNADYVLDVWVEKIETNLDIFGEGFILDMASVWRLTRAKDGKVLVCDFVHGHGSSHRVDTDAHGLSLKAVTRNTIKNGLLVLSDRSSEHLSAMSAAGIRPSMGSVIPEGLQQIRQGTESMPKDNVALTEIIDSIKRRDINKVKSLLDAQPKLINTADSKNGTLFHVAAVNGYRDIAEFLIDRGAAVNAINLGGMGGHTPLHIAAANNESIRKQGCREVAELLIAKGAEINAKAYNGYTPLHYAAALGNKDIAELLIAKEADINAKNNSDATPLKIAVDTNHKELADLLRQHGGVE
jgi:ankyrin repeat protein